MSPIGRNINDLFKDEQYRLIKGEWWQSTPTAINIVQTLTGRGFQLHAIEYGQFRVSKEERREALFINPYCSSLEQISMFRPIGLTLRAAPALATRTAVQNKSHGEAENHVR